MLMQKKIKNRPSWDEYFLSLAATVQTRSNCLRQSVGVVIVKDRRIIATGYNGTPAGIKNCFDGGCRRCFKRHENKLKPGERKDLCVCVHAEENALLQSAYHGVRTRGAILYSTDAPCVSCAKSMINSGITKIVYKVDHTDDFGLKLIKSAGIEIVQSI